MYTEEEKREHVRMMKESKQGMKEYSRRNGIPSSTLQRWRAKAEGKLIRVDKLGEEVEIELRSGARIKVSVSETELLKKVLEVLNAGA